MFLFGEYAHPAFTQLVTYAADHAVQEITGGQLHLAKPNNFLSLSEAVLVLCALYQGLLWLKRNFGSSWRMFFAGLPPSTAPPGALGVSSFPSPVGTSQQLFEQCQLANPEQLLCIAKSVSVEQLRTWVEAWKHHFESVQFLSIRIHPLPLPSVPVPDDKTAVQFNPRVRNRRSSTTLPQVPVPDGQPQPTPPTHKRYPSSGAIGANPKVRIKAERRSERSWTPSARKSG